MNTIFKLTIYQQFAVRTQENREARKSLVILA